MYKLESFNLELTTKCPLRCPQCYCSLEGGKDLPKDIAIRIIKEASTLGAKHVELSGGETLCYPYLYDLIHTAKENGIIPNIAVSGWHFDDDVMKMLLEAGVGGIFVSLNAPTVEQNSITRDGFEYAMHALELLSAADFQNYYINWVMHRTTADTLPEMIQLVKPFHPKGIVIMTPKPDASHTLDSLPTAEQMETVRDIIRENRSGIALFVESCFSPILALLGKTRLWGNLNRGLAKGCSAGILSVSVNVDGLFSPCRHIDLFEEWSSLQAYWEQSPVLRAIRKLENNTCELCSQCEFCENCRPCLAINSKLYAKLQIGNNMCPLGKKFRNNTEQ